MQPKIQHGKICYDHVSTLCLEVHLKSEGVSIREYNWDEPDGYDTSHFGNLSILAKKYEKWGREDVDRKDAYSSYCKDDPGALEIDS